MDVLADLLPLLTNKGQSENPLAHALAVLLNAAMLHEREKHIGAALYKRSEGRNGHANGYKERTLSTRLGQLNLSVPQVRGGNEPFRPRKRACLVQSLDAALLSEKALKVALAETYAQGVSTRRVSTVLESLCGTQVSSMTVSRAAKELDGVLGEWRERPLGVFAFVQLDALWCKVRQNGLVKDAAVLVASGVGEDGKRSLLGVSVSAQSFVPNDRAGEHEVHWRSFLESLVARGLRGVQRFARGADDYKRRSQRFRSRTKSRVWRRAVAEVSFLRNDRSVSSSAKRPGVGSEGFDESRGRRNIAGHLYRA